MFEYTGSTTPSFRTSGNPYSGVSELSFRALETGLKPVDYQIESQNHAVRPSSRKGCVAGFTA